MSGAKRIRTLADRLWDSPTATAWASLASRALGLVVVLPLVLRGFTEAEVALWQVLVLIAGFQLVADFGFIGTFSRFFAYAFGGARDLREGIAGASGGNRPSNWDLVGRIFAGMRSLYARMAAAFGALLLLGGTLSLVPRIGALQADPAYTTEQTTTLEGWVAWIVVLLVTYLNFRGSTYGAFLVGANRVAVVRRWEALFALLGIVSSLAVLFAGGRVLGLIVAHQGWALASVYRNRWLCSQLFREPVGKLPESRWSPDIMGVAWPAAWRSGVGVLTMYGLIQFSGILVAQMKNSELVASYLLGLRLVQTVNQLAQAPFYGKLPTLAQYWAQGRLDAIRGLATRGMLLAYWTFVLPAVGLGCFGPRLLEWIGSATPFPEPAMWWTLVWAYFMERFGAMHLQIHALSNRIIAHIANTGAGIILCVTSAVAWVWVGVLAIPIGMLAGNLSFYGWYCARLSYRTLDVNPLRMEAKLFLPACAALLAGTVAGTFIP